MPNAKRFSIVSVFFFVALACAAAQTQGAEVTTLAGSGGLGFADGPAAAATFIFPTGLAVGRNGTIYITDRGSQRIRELTTDGQVRTIAGSGPIASPGNFVQGGYQDGPAHQARFNGPVSVAIGPDGALYIADSYNACIRKISNGIVSTVLGKQGESAAVDGPTAQARLVYPSSIAFDASGNLFIADNGGGLREWTTAGTLVTHHLKNWIDPKYVLGVGVRGDTVLVTSRDGAFEYHPSGGEDHGWPARSPSEGDIPYGVANQVAGIDERQFIYTDELTNDLNYIRLPIAPFSGQVFARTIAGGPFERHTDNSGFADGTREASRFFAPMSVAIAGNSAIVADGGNRRIRKIVLPRTRFNETGFNPANQSDANHYEVALVGASWDFFDSLGDDSICGAIERVLDRSRRFSKPVRCHTVRIDASRSNANEDYIKNVFTVQHMDLVIMDAESWASDYNVADNIVPGDEPGTTARWGTLFRAHMQQLLDVLTPIKTQLALVWVYPARSFSNSEWITLDAGTKRPYPDGAYAPSSAQMQRELRGLPILQYDAFRDSLNYANSPGARQLYQGFDQHPNPRGNEFLGTHFAQGLLDAGLGKTKY